MGEAALQVWVADNAEERSEGLRDVARLPADVDGMLFVFDAPGSPVFVMEETLIPLDVWFFDRSGVLLGNEEMAPCEAEPCIRYQAPESVQWALETPLGAYEFEPGAVLTTSASD
ncbi:MAG: DUF192 domain-containing protein [Actinomycetota bacterium]|nr:DUF192 domain-containing protein [Actinomycetota bacterium]